MVRTIGGEGIDFVLTNGELNIFMPHRQTF